MLMFALLTLSSLTLSSVAFIATMAVFTLPTNYTETETEVEV